MTPTELLLFAIALLVLAAIAALPLAFALRARLAPGNSTQAAVERALQPFVMYALLASYRLSETSVEAGFDKIPGVSKKELADGTYRFLPERIGEFDLTFVKSHVPPARFQMLVQDAFDRFDRFYLLNHAYYDEAFRARGEAARARAVVAPASTASKTE